MKREKLEQIKESLEDVQDYLINARNLLRDLVFIADELDQEYLYSYLKALISDVEVLIDEEHDYLGTYNNVQKAIEIVEELMEEEEIEEEEEE